jgi:hypothetical protein
MTSPAHFLRRPALAVALAAAPLAPLCADDFGSFSRVNFGVQASVMQPVGELAVYASTGFGGSAYVEKVWSNSWAVRGRLEFLVLGEKVDDDVDNSGLRLSLVSKINQMGAMVDCIHYSGLADLPYFFAGVGFFNRNNTGTADVVVNGLHYAYNWKDIDSDAIGTDFAFSVGTGWNFTRHLGLEFKVTSSGAITWAQGSLIYRF